MSDVPAPAYAPATDPSADGAARIALPTEATMTPRQREVRDALVAGPRKGVRGPMGVWLVRPALAESAQALGRYCRFESSLPTRLSELAICTTARAWNAEFEWYAHKPMALKAGVCETILDAIRDGRTPPFEREDEAAVHAFVKESQETKTVSDATYARAVAAIGEEGVVDVVGIVGYYCLVSMTLNIFGVNPPPGAKTEMG